LICGSCNLRAKRNRAQLQVWFLQFFVTLKNLWIFVSFVISNTSRLSFFYRAGLH
jgi:hypothetical protein